MNASHRRIIRLELVGQKEELPLKLSEKLVVLIEKAYDMGLTLDSASITHDLELREGDKE